MQVQAVGRVRSVQNNTATKHILLSNLGLGLYGVSRRQGNSDLKTMRKKRSCQTRSMAKEFTLWFACHIQLQSQNQFLFSAWHQTLLSSIFVPPKRKIYMIHSHPSSCLHDYFIKAQLGERTFLHIIFFLLWGKKMDYTCRTKHTERKEKSLLHVQSFHCKLPVVYYGI